MTEVLLSERARDRLSNLETEIQERIKDALREINPDRDLSRLSGEDVYNSELGIIGRSPTGTVRRERCTC